jgi:hypothetical protein
MSKITIVSTTLDAAQLINNLWEEVGAEDSCLAEFIENLNSLPIIKECLIKAVNRLATNSEIQRTKAVLDYYGKAYKGRFDEAIKSARLPFGLGIRISGSGKLEFIADNYKDEWKREAKRLQSLFVDAFLAEITLAQLIMMGYEVKAQTVQTSDGSIAYVFEGEKHESC